MIILDSDFLINAIKNKVDVVKQIYEEFGNEICIVDKTIDELKKIDSLDSRAALKLIDVKKIKILKTTRDKIADELILKIVKNGDIVATQDKEFKKRLNKKGVKVITIKQKKFVN